MAKQKTHEEFQREVMEKGLGQYEVLSTYQKAREKVLMKHQECGHEYWVRPDHFKQGKRCPNCNLKVKGKKSHEQFEKEVHSYLGDEFEVLSTYKNAATNVLIKHKTCGYEQWIRPDNVARKKGCSKCKKNWKRIPTSRSGSPKRNFAKDVEILGKQEYELTSSYQSRRKSVSLKHLMCGHEYNIIARVFINGGGRCPKCYPKRNFSVDNISTRFIPKTTDQFKKEVESLYGKEYEVLTDYVKSEVPLKMKHAIETCGYEYMITPKRFKEGHTCIKCRERERTTNNSKGSQMVENVLIELGIPYEREVRFKECRHKQPLPFDFAITNEKGEPILLIEYDGEQHFMPVKYFGGMKRFVRQLRHDRIKSTFSKENNLPLLRVSYNQKRQEDFVRHAVKNFLKNKNSI